MNEKELLIWLYLKLNGDQLKILEACMDNSFRPASEEEGKSYLSENHIQIDEWMTLADSDYPQEEKDKFNKLPFEGRLVYKRNQ